MAESPKDPSSDKLDLKARLGLNVRKRTTTTSLPATPGLPQIESPVVEEALATEDSIREARERAEQAIQEAGPGTETFSLMGNEHTPKPAPLPSSAQVKYVTIEGSEKMPGANKRNLIFIGLAVLVISGITYIIGKSSGETAMKEERITRILDEAQEKSQFLLSQQAVLDHLNDYQMAIDQAESKLRHIALDNAEELKQGIEIIDKFIEDTNDFLAAEPNQIPLAEAADDNMLYPPLIRQLSLLSVKHSAFRQLVQKTKDEFQTLKLMSRMPPEENQRMLLIAEPDSREVPDLGEVPLSKGTMVLETGAPAPYQALDASRKVVTKYQQMVLVEGRDTPVQIETTQLMDADLKPFYAKQAAGLQRIVIARASMSLRFLKEQMEGIDAKPIRDEIDSVLKHNAK